MQNLLFSGDAKVRQCFLENEFAASQLRYNKSDSLFVKTMLKFVQYDIHQKTPFSGVA